MKTILGLAVAAAVAAAAVAWKTFSAGRRRQYTLAAEVRSPLSVRFPEPPPIRVVSENSSGPLPLGPETLSSDGRYRLFASSDGALIYPDEKRHALVVGPGDALAQVFVLPAGPLLDSDWSAWRPAEYREKGDDAWYTFLYGLKNKDRVLGPAPDGLEIRFRVTSRSHEEVERGYADAAAKRAAEKARRVAGLRADVAAGRTDRACRLVVEDLGATPAEFAVCKAAIEAKTKPAERWAQFALFLGEGNDGVAAWYEDELPGRAGAARDWGRKKVAVPDAEQAWFVGALLKAWLETDDATVLGSAYAVRNALQELSLGRQRWTDAARRIPDAELKKRLVARIRRADPKADAENSQSKFLIDFLEGRKDA